MHNASYVEENSPFVLSITVIPLLLVGITACGGKEEPVVQDKVGVEKKVKELTENEKAAAEFFRRVYYQTDEEAAMKLVDPNERENPFVEGTVNFLIRNARESPVKEQALQIITLEQKHVGETILVYHPRYSFFLIVKDGQVRMVDNKRIDWDVINDELDENFPYLENDWKEAPAK